jgi:flagellar basal-body rod modification protein FlgD
MVASVSSSTAALSSTSQTTGSTGVAGQMSAQDQTDRFMKLLVAQLNNQDPMNPMDNSQMTSQIAQINTVSGIQTLNDTVKSLSTQFASMQSMQGTSLIGHDVLTSGNTISINNGVGKGALNLASAADSVTVQVTSPGGQLLGTVNLGAMSAGQQSFTWDASGYTGSGNPTFTVTASLANSPVPATPLGRDTVTAISNDATGMSLTLQSGASVKYDSVKAIL